MLYGFIADLGCLGLLHVSLNWRLCCRPKPSTRIAVATPNNNKLLQALRVFIASGYICLMWWCLARFITLRQAIKKNAGTSSQDCEWSFEQVLGLASWVPVLVELAYVWWEGPAATTRFPVVISHDPVKIDDPEVKGFRQAEEIEALPRRQQLG
jgi:hypothetical protein